MKPQFLFSVRIAALALVLGSLSSGRADVQGDLVERYRVIIDRAPFGVTAAVQGGGAVPQSLARFSFVGLVSDASTGQLLAIIQDREKNRVYLRSEGETFDGVKVEKIDRSTAVVKGVPAPKLSIRQGLESAVLEFQVRVSAGPGLMPGMTPGVPSPAVPNVAPTVPVPRRIPFRRGEDKG